MTIIMENVLRIKQQQGQGYRLILPEYLMEHEANPIKYIALVSILPYHAPRKPIHPFCNYVAKVCKEMKCNYFIRQLSF